MEMIEEECVGAPGVSFQIAPLCLISTKGEQCTEVSLNKREETCRAIQTELPVYSLMKQVQLLPHFYMRKPRNREVGQLTKVTQ